MPVFHARMPRTNNHDLRDVIVRLRYSLVAVLDARDVDDGMEGLERDVDAAFVQAEREVLACGLGRFDVNVPHVIIDGRCHNRVPRASQTYTSAVGPVSVERTLYRAGKDKAVVPLEPRAGIVDGQWTPLAARQASFMVAHLAPQECENVLCELGNMTPLKSTLDRLPKALGERWDKRSRTP